MLTMVLPLLISSYFPAVDFVNGIVMVYFQLLPINRFWQWYCHCLFPVGYFKFVISHSLNLRIHHNRRNHHNCHNHRTHHNLHTHRNLHNHHTHQHHHHNRTRHPGRTVSYTWCSCYLASRTSSRRPRLTQDCRILFVWCSRYSNTAGTTVVRLTCCSGAVHVVGSERAVQRWKTPTPNFPPRRPCVPL